MTKLTPEAIAFRAKIDAEGPDWPDDLKEAATLLRCELDNTRLKDWKETGGPERLRKYASTFEDLLWQWNVQKGL